MAKYMTFEEACTRFANLATTGITIGAAIQEAVDTIYDMGRWPGTTYELPITAGMFAQNADEEWILTVDANTYDGVVAFRNATGGIGVSDIMALYHDGTKAGSLNFVDLGLTETLIEPGVGEDAEYTRLRKYRAPLGFTLTSLPMWALMKKQAPVLTNDSLVPVWSVGALRAAIQAVCYAYVTDTERATAMWNEFEVKMIQGEKQFHGNKRYSIGMDSSLVRRPHQFM